MHTYMQEVVRLKPDQPEPLAHSFMGHPKNFCGYFIVYDPPMKFFDGCIHEFFIIIIEVSWLSYSPVVYSTTVSSYVCQ